MDFEWSKMLSLIILIGAALVILWLIYGYFGSEGAIPAFFANLFGKTPVPVQ